MKGTRYDKYMDKYKKCFIWKGIDCVRQKIVVLYSIYQYIQKSKRNSKQGNECTKWGCSLIELLQVMIIQYYYYYEYCCSPSWLLKIIKTIHS